MPNTEPVHRVYILLRADLPPVQQIIQAAHATMEMAWLFPRPEGLVHICLLEVRDADALQAARMRLHNAGIGVYAFTEPDMGDGDGDGDGNGDYTAVATEPLSDDRRQPLKKYKLWGAGQAPLGD